MKRSFLAFDFGATSGRSVLGCIENGKLTMKELTRFPNQIVELHGRSYWNILSLFEAMKTALRTAATEGFSIEGIGIDTWGVDFVYIGADGSIVGLPRAYRDVYTNGAPESFFNMISRREVYDATGIQIMNFNSLFQLYAAKNEDSGLFNGAKHILFMPDAFIYLLTRKMVCEYTIASTSQILNPRTKRFEEKLLKAADVSQELLLPIIMPGTLVGPLTDDLAKESGLGAVPVIAVAGHDTASAIVAVPAENKNFAYLSSGTWSLMGIETDEPIISEASYAMNFTNEGGVDGTTRFLKNITGMWILEECRREWEKSGKQYSYQEMVNMAKSAPAFACFIDPDDPGFAHPGSMLQAIKDYCLKTGQAVPLNDATVIRCIFESLALKYRFVLERLKALAPFPIEKLHVIGGGAQNHLLNQFTANSIGLPVVAGPVEATAIGNILLQAKAVGLVNSLSEIRSVVKASASPQLFTPEDQDHWTMAYGNFLKSVCL